MAFAPYLFFVGTCREAMTTYQGIFGGELVIVTAAEMPDSPPDVPGDAVMHASLEIGGQMLMASDDPSATEDGPKVGFNVCVDAADPAEAQKWFDQLAEGGTVTMPIEATSWSPAFGMVTDRFGIPWMVSTNPAA
jgi:PhnB protein